MSKSISSQAIDQQHSRSEAGGSQSGPRAADPGNSELLPPSGAEARAEVGDPRRESSDPLKLSPRQVLALKCLANGVSITDAALSARVGRSTVHRWITEHPAFRAAYNRWKAAVQLSAQTRLIALQDLAVEVMSEELEEKRNGRLAALILTKMGALTASPSSATDPRRAGKEIETERQCRDVELARSATDADMDYFSLRHSKHLLRDDPPAAPGQDVAGGEENDNV